MHLQLEIFIKSPLKYFILGYSRNLPTEMRHKMARYSRKKALKAS